MQIISLLIYGLVARLTVHIPLYPVILLKRLMNGNSHGRIFAIAVSAIFQSYLYLAFIAFIVGRTLSLTEKGVGSLIVWFIAFFVAVYPIWSLWRRDSNSLKGTSAIDGKVGELPMMVEQKNMFFLLTRSEFIAFIVALIGFFLFAFIPESMMTLYWWVPYVG